MGCGRNLYILYTPDESDPLVSFVFRVKKKNVNDSSITLTKARRGEREKREKEYG